MLYYRILKYPHRGTPSTKNIPSGSPDILQASEEFKCLNAEAVTALDSESTLSGLYFFGLSGNHRQANSKVISGHAVESIRKRIDIILATSIPLLPSSTNVRDKFSEIYFL